MGTREYAGVSMLTGSLMKKNHYETLIRHGFLKLIFSHTRIIKNHFGEHVRSDIRWKVPIRSFGLGLVYFEKISDFGIIVFLFLFDKYYLIMD